VKAGVHILAITSIIMSILESRVKETSVGSNWSGTEATGSGFVRVVANEGVRRTGGMRKLVMLVVVLTFATLRAFKF